MRIPLSIIFLFFSIQVSYSQQVLEASGSDICLGYDMNVVYTEYATYNGAPIYNNTATSNQLKYITWRTTKWVIEVWDWNNTGAGYQELYINTTGNNTSPPLTGWIAGSQCPGLTPPELEDITMPVELVSFDVFHRKGENVLHWTTSSEINNEGFEIEFSKNGKQWSTIAFVEGQGTNLNLHDYEYIHRSNLGGVHMYRLRQVDFDGSSTYSDIVISDVKDDVKIKIQPNPVQNIIYIEGSDLIGYQIWDSNGNYIKKGILNESLLDVSELTKGLYAIEIISESANEIHRFIKM